jgi:hypothetical protein
VSGRWTSKDPLKLGGFSSNLFEFANGDPVNYCDKSGKFALGAGGLAASFAITGAAAGVGMQVFADVVNHKEPKLSNYIGAAVGGAIVGLGAWGGVTPWLAGAVAGGFGKLAEQITEGKGINPGEIALSMTVGGMLSGIIPGTSTGYGGTTAKMFTQFGKGQINQVSSQTAGRMINSRFREDAAYEAGLLYSMIMGLFR